MKTIVKKFGGSSVANIDCIQKVAEKVALAHKAGERIVVVLSAMGGETDRLLDLARSIEDDPRGRELDVLLSTGEQVTISLMCMALEALGINAISYTGAQIKILTDSAYNKARIRV